MKKTLLILFITIQYLSAAGKPEFFLTLEFYSQPFKTREWSITIDRNGNDAFIDIKNFRGRDLKKRIPLDEYVTFLGQLNKRSIWRLKDFYPQNSPSGYYNITIRQGSFTNSFKVEYGVPLTGKHSRYREIIRFITNRARLVLLD